MIERSIDFQSAQPKKPVRPLTAYHLFFQLEREYILQSIKTLEEEAATKVDDRPTGRELDNEMPLRYLDVHLSPCWYASASGKRERTKESDQKRKHRKTHGKIAFQELSRRVASGWATLDETDNEVKMYVVKIAKRELDIYKEKSKEYKALLETGSITAGLPSVEPSKMASGLYPTSSSPSNSLDSQISHDNKSCEEGKLSASTPDLCKFNPGSGFASDWMARSDAGPFCHGQNLCNSLGADRAVNSEATLGYFNPTSPSGAMTFSSANKTNDQAIFGRFDPRVSSSKMALGFDRLKKSCSEGKLSGSETGMHNSNVNPRFSSNWMTRSEPGPSCTKQNAFNYARFFPGTVTKYGDVSAQPEAPFLSGSMTSKSTADVSSAPLPSSLREYEDSFLYDCHKLAKQTSPIKLSQHQSPHAFNCAAATNKQFSHVEETRHTFAVGMKYENIKEPIMNARKRRSSEITGEIMPLRYSDSLVDEMDSITSEDAERLLRALSD